MTRIYRENFDDLAGFLAAVIARGASDGNISDPRLEFAASATGLNESVPSEGGFFVLPFELAQTVWDRASAVGQLLARVTRQPITRPTGTLALPAIDEISRANGSRYGGLSMAWLDTGEAFPESKPKFGGLNFNANKLGGVTYLTNALMTDSVALGAWFERIAAKELAFVLEDGIINGTGVGQMLGVLNSNATIEVAPAVGQTAATITGPNLASMAARFWAGSYATGVWLMGVSAFAQIGEASFSNGTPCVVYANDGRRYCLGFEIIVVESTAVLGARGDIILIDPSEFILAERESDVVSSLDLKFLTDESAIKFRTRIDGMPGWKSPVTPKDGGPTQSMTVTLGAR